MSPRTEAVTERVIRAFFDHQVASIAEVYAHPWARDDLATALRSGELPITEALIDRLDPDIEIFVAEAPDKPFVGRRGMIRMLQEWYEVTDAWEVRLVNLTVAGPAALACVDVEARGRTSGIPTKNRGWTVVEVRDEALSSWHEFDSLDEAQSTFGR